MPADHPVRFLREFVAELDLPALGFAMPSATAGRPAYAPSLLLKIWLYGYLHRIRSTRKLEGWSKEYMEKLLAALDTALAETELKLAEEPAPADPGYRLPAGLGERQALRAEIKAGLAQLAADGRQHYHPVEPEARRMKVGSTNRFAYNAQVVVDDQAGVIVACANTRLENDPGQLAPMIAQARANLGAGATETTTLADSGYSAGADVLAAEQKGFPVLVHPKEEHADEPYAAPHFVYDAVRATVTCPRGVQLDYQGYTTKQGARVKRYRCHCRDCPVRAQCTQDRQGRQIEVWPHTAAVQRLRQRLAEPAAQSLLARRGQIVERCFAQIKQHDGFRRWTVWGLAAVQTQWALLCTAVNLRILCQRWQAGRKSAAGALKAAREAAGAGLRAALEFAACLGRGRPRRRRPIWLRPLQPVTGPAPA